MKINKTQLLMLVILVTSVLFAGCGILSKADSQSTRDQQTSQGRPMNRSEMSSGD